MTVWCDERRYFNCRCYLGSHEIFDTQSLDQTALFTCCFEGYETWPVSSYGQNTNWGGLVGDIPICEEGSYRSFGKIVG